MYLIRIQWNYKLFKYKDSYVELKFEFNHIINRKIFQLFMSTFIRNVVFVKTRPIQGQPVVVTSVLIWKTDKITYQQQHRRCSCSKQLKNITVLFKLNQSFP